MATNLKTQFTKQESSVNSTLSKISKVDDNVSSYKSMIESTLEEFDKKSNEFVKNLARLETTKKKVEDARIELMTLEIKIKHLNEEDFKISRFIDEENTSFKTLKMIIDNKSKEYNDLSLIKQESLIADYVESLEKEPIEKLHSLLSLISTFQEITLRAIKSQRNIPHDLHRMSQAVGNTVPLDKSSDKILDWNSMFCDYFKNEILEQFDSDYQEELKTILIKKFDDIKINSNINFVRWLNKVIKMDKDAKDCNIEEIDEKPKFDICGETSKKKWSNLLKNVSNHVAYIMKGSSFFLSYTNHITKYFSKDIDKTKQMKKLEIQFSHDLFQRHNKLIQNVVKYEKFKPNIDDLNTFSREVCQYCKEEIGYQEDYQNRFLFIMMEE